MKAHNDPTNDAIWTTIRRENRRDTLLRWVSFAAWTVTLALLIVYAAMVASEVARIDRLVTVGAAAQQDVFEATIPLIAVVGTVMLVVATLSTIGIFLRMRTATLSEIQLRLAALESMLAAEPDSAA